MKKVAETKPSSNNGGAPSFTFVTPPLGENGAMLDAHLPSMVPEYADGMSTLEKINSISSKRGERQILTDFPYSLKVCNETSKSLSEQFFAQTFPDAVLDRTTFVFEYINAAIQTLSSVVEQVKYAFLENDAHSIKFVDPVIVSLSNVRCEFHNFVRASYVRHIFSQPFCRDKAPDQMTREDHEALDKGQERSFSEILDLLLLHSFTVYFEYAPSTTLLNYFWVMLYIQHPNSKCLLRRPQENVPFHIPPLASTTLESRCDDWPGLPRHMGIKELQQKLIGFFRTLLNKFANDCGVTSSLLKKVNLRLDNAYADTSSSTM